MLKVSIIIPTLNRAHLLKYAIKSAINQDYKDLEIIVCDDFSEDNTKEVVESFDSKDIVYVKANKRLNMPDTFEFALNKAKGDYLTFLTDASFLLPNTISMAIRELNKFNVKLAMWRHCGYFTSDWIEIQRKNTLYIPKFTLESYLLDSKKYLKKFYNNIREPLIPKSINSLCHRSIIKKAITTQKRFFLPPCPDHASAVGMLMNTPKFVLIDWPLFVGSVSSVNIGASQSFNLGKSAQNFLKGFGKKMDDIAFLGIYTTSALIIKSLENVKKFYPNCPEINIKNAFFEVVDSTAKLHVYGVDVKDYWRIINNYIDKNCNQFKNQVLVRRIKSLIKWRVVKIIRLNSLFYNFESIFRGIKILDGNKYDFTNIEEAAKIVQKLNNKNSLKHK